MRFVISGIIIIIGVIIIITKSLEVGREDGPPVFTIRGRAPLCVGITFVIIGIVVAFW